MFCKVLRAKIHRATITETDPDYVGSITIDEDLLRATGIRPNEVVLIADVDNGARFETYVLKGEAGSGVIGINGAAARLVSQGDKIIIFAHLLMDPSGMESHHAEVVVVDEANRIAERLRYPGSLSEDPASLVEDGAATGYRPERDPSTPLAARNSLLEP